MEFQQIRLLMTYALGIVPAQHCNIAEDRKGGALTSRSCGLATRAESHGARISSNAFLLPCLAAKLEPVDPTSKGMRIATTLSLGWRKTAFASGLEKANYSITTSLEPKRGPEQDILLESQIPSVEPESRIGRPAGVHDFVFVPGTFVQL